MTQLKALLDNNPYRQTYPEKWDELYDFMLNHKNSFGSLFKNAHINLNHKYRQLHDWIIEQTPLLNNERYQMSTRIYWILNGLVDFPICQHCHQQQGYINRNVSPYKEPYRQYCSIKCMNQSNAHKHSCQQTTYKRYHVNAYCQTEVGKHILGIKHRQRNYDTFIKNLMKRNIILLTDKEEYIKYGSSSVNIYKCLNCGNIFQTKYTDAKHAVCQVCKNSGISNEERQFRNFLMSLTQDIPIFNARVLQTGTSWRNWKEIDIYFPDMKIGFEYDGIYFHSYENNTDVDYHLMKTKIAESLGIRLVHIRSDQFKTDTDYWKILISQMLNDNINVFEYAKIENNIYKFDRSIFNKCWFNVNDVNILYETQPIIHDIKHKTQVFHYYDCGSLYVSKVNSNYEKRI